MPSFSNPAMTPDNTQTTNKGKSRQPEQLAPPSATTSANTLSGNIGSSSSAAPKNIRTVGGVRVETRYFHCRSSCLVLIDLLMCRV